MKKFLVSFIIVVRILSINIFSKAEYVNFEDWETGDMHNYEVYSFDEMFSVFEDLNSEYDNLIEEYHSLEKNYKELSSQLQQKEEELKELEEYSHNKISLGTNDEFISFIKLILIIIIIYSIICFIKNVFNKIKERKK